jgi:UDP-N-acetyl-D-mannosaminuronate dehydrogenase
MPVATAIQARPDCFVICTDHSTFDWSAIVKCDVPIVDTRNALKQFDSPCIVRLSGRALPLPAFQ